MEWWEMIVVEQKGSWCSTEAHMMRRGSERWYLWRESS